MAGKSPNAILALAIGSCSLITKENLSHHRQMLRFRSRSWKPKGLNQNTKPPKKKKKKRDEEPYQTKSLQCTHRTCTSPQGEEREPEPPTADVRRSVSGAPGSRSGPTLRSVLRETTKNFTTKILVGTVRVRKMYLQRRGPWNQAFLVLRSL